MRTIVLAAALACLAATAQARTLKQVYSDDAHALLAVDVDTLSRDGAKVTVDIYYIPPAPEPVTVGDTVVQREDEVIQTQFDCAARKVRSLGSRMEDLTSDYPGEVGAQDWAPVSAGAPSGLVMIAVCADPPTLPDQGFATVADMAGPYRAGVQARKAAQPQAGAAH